MKKTFIALLFIALARVAMSQAGPGLVISEILSNPPGSDSPFEFVELVATRTINFSVTPYSVVFSNNGTATVQGWIAGGGLTYGFDITTGVVNAGDVVYVGGSSMIATGTVLRSINTGTTNGDGFGTFNASGVLGNGGSNADGIAVFNLPVSSLNNNTEPVDALIFGAAVGSAEVNGGADGYQLPVNDLYPGGKLNALSALGPDPGSGDFIKATGTFNPVTGVFTSARAWTTTTSFTDGTTSIVLSTATPSVTVSFSAASQHVDESAGTATVNINITNPNNTQVVFHVAAHSRSNATDVADYSLSATDFVVPAASTATQTVTVNINDDAVAESDEYIILEIIPVYNTVIGSTPYHYLFVQDNDLMSPQANNEVSFDLLTSFSNGAAGSNSAEIVAYDPTVQRLYIANSVGAKIDIVDFSNPASPTMISSLDISPYGNINSVDVRDGIVAAAIENGINPQDSGKVVFFDYQGAFIKQVKVGAMPDMITFNHAGTRVLTACEGEPNTAYTLDPDGDVCIIDISGGVAAINQSNVTFVGLTSFNGQEAALRAMGIRIFGPGASASQDFEPEYIAINETDDTAWVSLQENNAMLEIELNTNTITQIIPLGTKDYMLAGNRLDASNQSPGINLSNMPVKGMYMPDAIHAVTINGKTFVLSANEGDTRSYAGYDEESRVNGLNLDPGVFPDAAVLKHNHFLGRLVATTATGDTDNDGDIDEIHVLGGRSFSIWNPASGSVVFDSGDDFERYTSTHPVYSQMFNASNGGSISVKDRSDDKGPEPEGVVTGIINGHHYAFIGQERIGGAFIYNIDDIQNPYFVSYANNRDVATNGPDRGAEGIIFIPATDSPDGSDILILANEISSTLTIYKVTTCLEKAGIAVLPASDVNACAGDSVFFHATQSANTNYQWLMNDSPLVGATDTSIYVSNNGTYALQVINTTFGCTGLSAPVMFTQNALPAVSAGASANPVCQNQPLTLSGSGALNYSWDNGVTDGVAFVATSPGTTLYTVTGTDANGCSNTGSINVTVNAAPSPSLSVNGNLLSTGSFSTYQWYLNGNPIPGANAQNYTATQNGAYFVVVTNGSGCSAQTGPFNLTSVSVASVAGDEPWRVYPNPFADEIRVFAGAEQGTIRVTNILGEAVLSIPCQALQQYTINTSDWPAGMYLFISPNGIMERVIKR